jgi:hypothetical protein
MQRESIYSDINDNYIIKNYIIVIYDSIEKGACKIIFFIDSTCYVLNPALACLL